jgi:hypothetical protein
VKSEHYRIKFACDIEGHTLKVIPSTMAVFIGSAQEKIVKFIYSLVIQREKDGMLNLPEALKNTTLVNPSLDYASEVAANKKRYIDNEDEEMAKRMAYLERIINLDRTSSIYRVRIPNPLLEKIILYVEFKKEAQISLAEIEEYSQLLNKKSDEFSCSVPSSYGITVEEDTESYVVRSSLLDETFYIPSVFKLNPNFEDTESKKNIEEFEPANIIKFRGNVNRQRLHTLFSLCGLDYYFYQTQQVSDVDKSAYLLRLYRALIDETNRDSINLTFLTVGDTDTDDLITYECSPVGFNWKPVNVALFM